MGIVNNNIEQKSHYVITKSLEIILLKYQNQLKYYCKSVLFKKTNAGLQPQ